jgi:exopolysaccharide production protein ExoZ
MAEPHVFFPGIHALRALAAILVVYSHAEYVAHEYGGLSYEGRLTIPLAGLGVILFFAISGFVIALQRRKPVGVFLKHRFLRIYPSYWLAGVLALVAFKLSGREIANSPGIGTTVMSFLLFPWSEGSDATTIPYWTLAFEMTFYILAAIAFWLRLSDRTLAIIAVLWIVAVDFFASDPAGAVAYSFPGAMILLSSAVQIFPIGLVCGIHFDKFKRAGRWPYAAGACLALVAGLQLEEFSVLRSLILGMSAACLILAVADIAAGRIVATLGNASYGIYLMHFPAMIVAAQISPKHGFLWFFIVGMISGLAFGLFDHWLYQRMITAPRIGSAQQSPAP